MISIFLRVQAFYTKIVLPLRIRLSTAIMRKQLYFCGINVRFRGRRVISKPQYTLIGNNVHIGDNAYFKTDGGLLIGNNVVISRNVTIYTINHQYEGDTIPYDAQKVKKSVIIGDNVWIGMNVSVIPGVSIGEGAVIGIGSVVTKDVPPLAIVGGNPAIVLKTRDSSKYFNLKQANKISNRDGVLLDEATLSRFKSIKIPDFIKN